MDFKAVASQQSRANVSNRCHERRPGPTGITITPACIGVTALWKSGQRYNFVDCSHRVASQSTARYERIAVVVVRTSCPCSRPCSGRSSGPDPFPGMLLAPVRQRLRRRKLLLRFLPKFLLFWCHVSVPPDVNVYYLVKPIFAWLENNTLTVNKFAFNSAIIEMKSEQINNEQMNVKHH